MANKKYVAMLIALAAIVSAVLPIDATYAKYAKYGKRNNPGSISICHFPGHNGDFVTFNSEFHPAGTPICNEEGGNAMTVTPKACSNGHKAIENRFDWNRTCEDGHLQPTQ